MTDSNIYLDSVELTVQEACPSKNIIPKELYQQFNFRKYDQLEGENSITVLTMQEPVWWNRPLKAETNTALVFTDEAICCALPLYNEQSQVWKTKYNVLVNKNNLPTLIQLNFKQDINSLERYKKQALAQMSFRVIYQTLIKLGVPDSAFCCLNNDLLLNGKKFVGSEKVCKGSAYTECLFINLKYLEEKELFDQIYVGKKTNVKPITGILDEYPNITKEDFVKTYLAEFKTYLSEHFKVTFNS